MPTGYLDASAQWGDVPHFVAGAVLSGGPSAPDNIPLQSLADRTEWLKVEQAQHAEAVDPHPQYTTQAEVEALVEARVGDYVTATASGNAYTVVLDPPVTAYTAKMQLLFKAPSANTGAATLNAGGGAKSIMTDDGSALKAGDIAAGAVVGVVFDVASDAWRVAKMMSSQLAQAVQRQAYTACTTTGTSPTFLASPAPAIASYVSGLRLAVTFHASSTGSATLNVSSLGAKSIKVKDRLGAKKDASVPSGLVCDVVYDGTDWVILAASGDGVAYTSIKTIVTSQTLVSGDVGCVCVVSAGAVVTLPAVAALLDGCAFAFRAVGACSIKGAGSDVIASAAGSANTLSLLTGETVTVTKSGSAWTVAAAGFGSCSYQASRLQNGWDVRPDGTITQWGRIHVPGTSASAVADVTFPVPFPNACLSFVASVGIYSANYDQSTYRTSRQDVSYGAPSTSGVPGQVFLDNNLGQGRLISWTARGY